MSASSVSPEPSARLVRPGSLASSCPTPHSPRQGLVFGLPHARDVDGFADPAFRLSMNFVGAPALTAAEFKNYRQDLIFGMSLRVTAPLGEYDAEKLVNIGTNRWSFKPEIGFSKAFGPWTVELAPGVTFYTDNGDFFGGKTRQVAPLYLRNQASAILSRPAAGWRSTLVISKADARRSMRSKATLNSKAFASEQRSCCR